jgi:hypothetical protein
MFVLKASPGISRTGNFERLRGFALAPRPSPRHVRPSPRLDRRPARAVCSVRRARPPRLCRGRRQNQALPRPPAPSPYECRSRDQTTLTCVSSCVSFCSVYRRCRRCCTPHVHRPLFRPRLPRLTCPPRRATWVSSRTTSRRSSPCARVSLRSLRTQAARPRSTSVRALLSPAQRGSLTHTTSRSVGRVPYCAPEQPPHNQRC